MNAQRVAGALAKLNTPDTTEYPLPPAVKRMATVAPWAFIVEPSRMSKASAG